MSASSVLCERIYNAAARGAAHAPRTLGSTQEEKLLHVGRVTAWRPVTYGDETALDFLRLCPVTQSASPSVTPPDAIRRATIGRFVAILVFSFVPFMFVFICRLCVIFRGPPSVAFNFIFLLPFYFFIYLPWHLKLASVLEAKLCCNVS